MIHDNIPVWVMAAYNHLLSHNRITDPTLRTMVMESSLDRKSSTCLLPYRITVPTITYYGWVKQLRWKPST